MPRSARTKSETGIYHVMLRGADRRIIFSVDEDCDRFLDTLQKARESSGFKLYAYCLMGNHVHLLIEEEKEPLELIFKRIGASYVYYYNWKYGLHGHLFQDRFLSEPVESDAYFLDVLRYICQNPVKAGLCSSPSDYPWLACCCVGKCEILADGIQHLTDIPEEDLIEFLTQPCTSSHLEDNGSKRLTDREASDRICKTCGCKNVQEIGGWDVQRRDDAVLAALDSGVSIRQLSRLTAISKAVIERICRENV